MKQATISGYAASSQIEYMLDNAASVDYAGANTRLAQAQGLLRFFADADAQRAFASECNDLINEMHEFDAKISARLNALRKIARKACND